MPKYAIFNFYNKYLFKAIQYIVSVLGRDEGYTVKYTPLAKALPEGDPEGKAPEGKGVYLTTVNPVLSSNMESISF